MSNQYGEKILVCVVGTSFLGFVVTFITRLGGQLESVDLQFWSRIEEGNWLGEVSRTC